MPSLLSYDFFHTINFLKSQEESLSQNEITLPIRFSKYGISFLFLRNTISSLIYIVFTILLGKFVDLLSKRTNFIHNHIKSQMIKNFIFHLYNTIAWNMVIWYILSILPEI